MQIHASLKAENLFSIGPVSVTNSMLMSWITIVIIASIGIAAGRNPQLVPRGIQNFFEFVVEGLMGLVENTAGHYARRVFPLIATLFMYILLANWLALVPGVGSICIRNPEFHGDEHLSLAGCPLSEAAAGSATSHAFVSVAEAASAPPASSSGTTKAAKEHHVSPTTPLFRAANADVNMTLGMGLIAFLFIHASGMIVHGVWGYIKNDLANPPLMTPIKLVIEMFVPVSLSMRLFGNVFGGEMLLTVMGFPIIAVLFMFAELFFGFIQAIIFSILTLIFTSVAAYVPPGHGGHGPGDHAEEATGHAGPAHALATH
jgi:F-type H+-transporting ATPase subunit a